jgi:hypothetical protein
MKNLFFAGALLSFSHLASAAFPPFAETAYYINSILTNKQVSDRLGIQNPINQILRDGDTYKVYAGKCHLNVVIVSKKVEGPVPPIAVPYFDLSVGSLECE